MLKLSTNKQSIKPNSTLILEARGKAKREGWHKYIRQGLGETSDELAMVDGYYVDQYRIDNVVNFYENYSYLVESAFAGQPFRLMPWQQTLLSELMGWCRYETEWQRVCRRFRVGYVVAGKKIGKSPLESVLGAYLLTADSPDVQSNVSSVGPTRAVAQRMLTFINRMKKHSPELDAVIDVTRPDGFLQITHNDNVWTPLPAEPASVEGLQSHILIDELHRLKGAGAWEFFEALMYALAAMPDGMFFTITNAGDDPTSPARYLYEKTIDVNLGRVVDHQHYGKLFECLPSDDLDDERNWYKANPSLGDESGMIPGTDIPAPLKLSQFRAEFQTAKRNPRTWQNFKRLRFSIWTSAADSWLDGNVIGGYQAWDAGEANRSLSTDLNLDCYRSYNLDYLEELANNNCPCYFSFDLASVRDTTSAVFTIHDIERDELLTHALCFLPEDTVAASQNRILYETAAERGELTITPGQVTNVKAVIDSICEVAAKLNPLSFAYDPWQASMLYQEIANRLCIEPIKFPQTFSNYHPLLNEAERLIALRKIRHNGNSLFNWQLGNMRVRRNSEGQKRPEKQLLNAELKIDIAVSFVMSLAKFCEVAEETGSYYDDNEVESV